MGEEAHRLFRERYTLERMADAYASLFSCVIARSDAESP
jgi:hypothetical protein